MNFEVWQCPGCGYLIADVEMQAFLFDYGCPRCFISFSEFVLYPEESHGVIDSEKDEVADDNESAD